jgi:hypothetical protein
MIDPKPANDDAPTKARDADGMVSRVNRVTVSAALLAEVMRLQMGELPGGRPEPEAQMLRVFQLLIAKGVSPGRIGEFATAVDFRLTALARLQQAAGLRGWPASGCASGVSAVPSEILTAAATEPLIEDADGEPAFDEHAFRRRLLAAVKADGSA